MVNASVLAKKVLDVLGHLDAQLQPKVVPTPEILASVIEEVFWSSLDKYEDVPLRARIYIAPAAAVGGRYSNITRLEPPIEATRANIRRFSPAHGRHGGLVVLADAEKATIAGVYASDRATEPTHPGWLCVECTGTGVVRIRIPLGVLVEFVRGNVKVFGGVSFDRDVASMIVARTLRADDTHLAFCRASNVSRLYLSIAEAIERRGAGGALWLLPENSPQEDWLRKKGRSVAMSPTWAEPFREDWEMRTSQIRISNPPILSPHGEEIFWMAQEWDRGKRENRANGVADLARVDGAILANVTPDVLAFGVVCNNFETLRQTQATTARLRLMRLTDPSRPFEGGTEAMPEEFGGSRHQSAIDFCSNLAPAAAIVASHDGGITVFVSGEPGEVRGMRISGISSTNRVPPSADPPIA